MRGLSLSAYVHISRDAHTDSGTRSKRLSTQQPACNTPTPNATPPTTNDRKSMSCPDRAIGILRCLSKPRRTPFACKDACNSIGHGQHMATITRVTAALFGAMLTPSIAHAQDVSNANDAASTAPAAPSEARPAADPQAPLEPSGTPDVPATARHSHRNATGSLSLEALGISSPDGARSGAIDYTRVPQTRGAASYLWPLVDVAGINLTLWSIP